MANGLKGKRALVTGGTSGIGRGIAEALADAGARVAINGFGAPDEIEALRADLSARSGEEALYHGADMSRPEEIGEMIETLAGAMGGIDILVNNAGIQHVAPLEDFPPEKWDAIIAVNLSAAFHTIRGTLGPMKARGWGRIVNIASAHSLIASPHKAAYIAAKHGLAGLTKTAALESAENGVTVNAVSPGFVLTPLVEAQIPDLARTRGISEESVVRDVILAGQPSRKFVEISEVAGTVAFLCSDAGAGITGANLSVDGGWTAQ